jgi:hypothetical protein
LLSSKSWVQTLVPPPKKKKKKCSLPLQIRSEKSYLIIIGDLTHTDDKLVAGEQNSAANI